MALCQAFDPAVLVEHPDVIRHMQRTYLAADGQLADKALTLAAVARANKACAAIFAWAVGNLAFAAAAKNHAPLLAEARQLEIDREACVQRLADATAALEAARAAAEPESEPEPEPEPESEPEPEPEPEQPKRTPTPEPEPEPEVKVDWWGGTVLETPRPATAPPAATAAEPDTAERPFTPKGLVQLVERGEVLDGRVRFARGSVEPDGGVPSRVMAALRGDAGLKVWIVGAQLADEPKGLGLARAEAVAAGLVGSGVSKSQLRARDSAELHGYSHDGTQTVTFHPASELQLVRAIEFAPLSDALAEGARDIIRSIASTLGRYSDMRMLIEGHSDAAPMPPGGPGNQELSAARAGRVRSELILAGIDSSRLESGGLGETLPVASNACAEGRRRNRRVELLILDLDEA